MAGLRTFLLGATATALLIVLLVSLRNRLEMFHRHEIGVTVTKVDHHEDIPFPAVSVCLWHYDFQRLKDDLGIPQNPFAPTKSPWMSAPGLAYKMLGSERGEMNISHFLHTYYVMVDELFIPPYYLYKGCTVGGYLCDVKRGAGPKWSSQPNSSVEAEVGTSTTYYTST